MIMVVEAGTMSPTEEREGGGKGSRKFGEDTHGFAALALTTGNDVALPKLEA